MAIYENFFSSWVHFYIKSIWKSEKAEMNKYFIGYLVERSAAIVHWRTKQVIKFFFPSVPIIMFILCFFFIWLSKCLCILYFCFGVFFSMSIFKVEEPFWSWKKNMHLWSFPTLKAALKALLKVKYSCAISVISLET